MSRTYRNRMMLVTAALSMALLLGACTSAPSASGPTAGSSANESAAGQQASQQQQQQQQPGTPATREFEHAGGISTVPAEPQRIVADWYYGELLALGVRPIGYPAYLLSEYTYADSAGTEGFGESIEQIVELEPDLIISTWDDSYTEYSQVAPSVLLKLNDGLVSKMRTLGELVNRQQEAENWVASFESKLAAAKQKLAEQAPPETTVTILGIFQKNVKVYGYHNMGGDLLYNLLEVQPPAHVQGLFTDDTVWNQNISLESLPEIAGTHLILTAYDPEDTGREMLEQLEQSQIWKGLDAVKNGRVLRIPYYELFFDDPIAIEHQIEKLTDWLTE